MSTGNRIALHLATVALAAGFAAGLAGGAAAQTGYTQPLGTTQAGPSRAPAALPPGVGSAPGPSRPAYQSTIGLPYGPGNPAPYAYGGGVPRVNDPNVPQTPEAIPGKPSMPTATLPGTTASAMPGVEPALPGGEDAAAAGASPGVPGASRLPGPDPAAPPFDPRVGAAQRTYSGPGNGQPVIQAAPAFRAGDPYARAAGSPSMPPPIGASPYTRPYTVDALGNYYNSQGGYVGKVDSKGQVRDRYGNVRGTVAR